MSSKVLVTGAKGQLGSELQLTCPSGWEVLAADRSTLDIADVASLHRMLDEAQPTAVINAAAYTAVDQAEAEPEVAARSNAEGPAILAAACAERDIRLVHISTDFVFDGRASQPYHPDDATGPLGEYGRGKLAGEQGTQSAYPASLIIRTGWVYSRFGGNFVKTMLRLMAEREQLSVVVDQVGTPTWARGLALTTWAGVKHGATHGIYHWSDAGVCSWYDFAVAIQEEALALGLLPREIAISPIPASEYPTPAIRPSYSVLDKSSTCRDLDVSLTHWRAQLRAMLIDLKDNSDV